MRPHLRAQAVARFSFPKNYAKVTAEAYMTQELVTHDGRFHADEVLSTIILTGLFPEATIVRTRAADLITPREGRIVYDVGGAYDPARNIYDHHQMGAPLREDATPFSSFGLVWGEFGKAWMERVAGVDMADIDKAWLALDRSFVKEVDALDNGVQTPGMSSPLNLTRLIEALSPDFDAETPESMDAAFRRAVSLTGELFAAQVRTVTAKIRAARTVSAILDAHDGGPILELPYGMPWEGTMRKAGADHILLTIIPRESGDWTMSCVRASPGSFDNRMDLPEAWAGLTGAELAAASGVPDAVFCHRARFFAIAGSREGIMEMARKALEVGLRAEPTPGLG